MATPKVRIDLDINQALADKLTKERLERGMRAVGIQGEASVKAELSRPGQGRLYQKGGVSHRASKPGDPPAPDTGELRKSVTHEVEEIFGGGIRTTIIANKEYAAALELGTEKMSPRPFMRSLLGKYLASLRAAFVVGSSK